VVELGHAISHAGFSRRTAIGLSSRRPWPPLIDRWRCRLCPVAGVVAWGKSILLHGFQKQIVVPRGVALQFLLQKHENIRNYLQFILHDVDRINLASREFR
jgi:hypothetical protein